MTRVRPKVQLDHDYDYARTRLRPEPLLGIKTHCHIIQSSFIEENLILKLQKIDSYNSIIFDEA